MSKLAKYDIVMVVMTVEIKVCKNHIEQFKGLMFKKNFDYALKLRCNGIHTFFMKQNIDVVLTDKDEKVLKIYYDVKPNRIIWPQKNVYYTYEFPSHSQKYKVGDKIR